MNKVVEEGVPGMVYFGSRDSAFFHYGLSEETKSFFTKGEAVLMVVDMKSEIPYPLSGVMKPASDFADLMGAMAGTVLMIDRQGRLMRQHIYNSLAHNNDPVIIRDMVYYHIENVDPDKETIFEFGKTEDHEQQWDAFLQRSVSNNHLVRNWVKDLPHQFVDEDGQTKYIAKALQNRFLVITEVIEKVTYVQVVEIVAKYEGDMKITVVARKDQKELFQQFFSKLRNVEFKELSGSQMYEFPLNMYSNGSIALSALGYAPSDVLHKIFEINDLMDISKKYKNQPVVDLNMPIGEHALWRPEIE
jgi:hypothetical protein